MNIASSHGYLAACVSVLLGNRCSSSPFDPGPCWGLAVSKAIAALGQLRNPHLTELELKVERWHGDDEVVLSLKDHRSTYDLRRRDIAKILSGCASPNSRFVLDEDHQMDVAGLPSITDCHHIHVEAVRLIRLVETGQHQENSEKWLLRLGILSFSPQEQLQMPDQKMGVLSMIGTEVFGGEVHLWLKVERENKYWDFQLDQIGIARRLMGGSTLPQWPESWKRQKVVDRVQPWIHDQTEVVSLQDGEATYVLKRHHVAQVIVAACGDDVLGCFLKPEKYLYDLCCSPQIFEEAFQVFAMAQRGEQSEEFLRRLGLLSFESDTKIFFREGEKGRSLVGIHMRSEGDPENVLFRLQCFLKRDGKRLRAQIPFSKKDLLLRLANLLSMTKLRRHSITAWEHPAVFTQIGS